MADVRIYLTKEITTAPYEEILYEFPRSFSINGFPFARRASSAEKAYSHGAVITSDRKIRARDIIISGTLHGTTPTELEGKYSSLVSALAEENLKLTVYFEDIYLNVEMVDFKHDYYRGSALRYANVSIQFHVADTFRYSKTMTSETFNITSSEQNIQLTNSGDIFANAIITLLGGVGSSVSKIRIINRDDGNKYFEYESLIENGDEIIINSEDGTVNKNGSNDISNFSGLFPIITKGTDDLVAYITGSVGLFSIKFEYRQRWI